MDNIYLTEMTNEMYHQFFKDFEYDSDTFMDMSLFCTFEYNYEMIERYIQRQRDKKRMPFAIMLNDVPIGEIMLKDIDYDKRSCVLSIHMQNDSVKNKGYGVRQGYAVSPKS